MLEWLAAATGVELGKLVLEQVLNLGKAALEDYIKDFFKHCIGSGVAQLKAETLKPPMAEAIGFLIKRFIKELQLNDVPETSIDHHFKAAIKRFVQDKAVRPILGKAFEKNCKQIDYQQLEQIWTQQYQAAGWYFPNREFDWRRVAKEYVLEVQSIIKANAELRSLLETELLEEIAQNTAQLSPGFNLATYRASLQCSYGSLKLYTLDSTDRADTIKLWNMFIEQTVRYALAQSTNFLDFLHRGQGADWQFDQQQLHQHLLENPTLVMFDGLDEVFDRPTQSTIVDDIVRFSQQYPYAKVLVTSRIIGYNPEAGEQKLTYLIYCLG